MVCWHRFWSGRPLLWEILNRPLNYTSTIFTARVRRMMGGYVFTRVCLLTGGIGWGGGYPIPPDWGGEGTPSFPMRRGRYPIVLGKGTPSQQRGPHPRLDGDTSHQDWMGYPQPLSNRTGWELHPPPPGMVGSLTGYAAGGTPLAVSHRRTFL